MGYIMNRCKKCNVSVENDELICPLCHSVLEKGDGSSKESMYPSIEFDLKRYHIAIRIFVFSAIFLELVLLFINYIKTPGLWWSVICGGGIVFAFITLKSTLSNNTGHIMNLFIQAVSAIGLTILIDYIVGYTGWSVDYAIPTTIFVMDSLIVILMIVNRNSWQNYLLLQIFMNMLGLLMVVLYMFGVVKHPLLNFIALICSVVIFIATITIGEKTAENELKRRFHI